MAEVFSPPVNDRQDDLAGYMGEINPAFSFPMGPASPAVSPRTMTPASTSTRSRPTDISISTTPSFLFPPPTTPPIQETAQSSPGRSRPAGHRRGPSEFIGGDGSKLGPGLMSTSPTKGENVLPAPSTSGRRRGHAHRRSAAISHHDLASIVNRPDLSSRRTGSAPATPCEPDMQFKPMLDRSRSQPTLPNNNSLDLSDRPDSPTESASTSAISRPRVGFSDKLEYIPRPLSVISSATSSSVSTIRPSHSMNNRITSLRSLGTSSPPSARKEVLSDDVFGGDLHDNLDTSPIRDVEGRCGRASSRARRHSPPPPSSQEHLPLPEEEDSLDVHLLDINALDHADFDSAAPPVPQLRADLSRLRGVPDSTARPRSSPDSSQNKRSTRGKSWGDLLSRKGKHELIPLELVPRRSPSNGTPEVEPDFLLEDINFDDDSTYVIRSPEYDVTRSAQSNPSPLVSSFDQEDDETDVGPVLDLDEVWYRAGMSSNKSNTPQSRQPKRAMHSSGTTGGFTGLGMHYHRRAESAPVMPPVDYSLGFPRYGSNPQMADVFEEEEDDYNQNSLSRQVSRQHKSVAKSQKVDTLSVNVEESLVQPSETSLLPVTEDLAKTTNSNSDPSRLLNFSFPTQPSDRSLRKGNDLSIQTVANNTQQPPLSAPATDASSPTPTQPSSIHNYASSHISYPSQSDRASAFHSSASVEASPLQTSFDVPRLGTAHSSGTNRSTWSSARTGESAHPTSTSMDDVPSLISSSSTMISHMPHTPIVGSRPTGERAHSMSVESSLRPRTPLQAAKRASLASLSKLMGGSFSEKSKLSIESRADYEEAEDNPKISKRHRISRLMKFWKSKEDIRSIALREGPRTS